MDSPKLDVRSVSVRYGRVEALRLVGFTAHAGVTLLLGRNGTGKTSLCRVLAGAQHPHSGALSWTAAGAPEAGRRNFLRATGWLPQIFDAPPAMTVRAYLEYAAWLKEVPRRELAEALDGALVAVDLADRAGHEVSALSGGMLRRLGIAQALVNRPRFLILDEPTVGLDPEQRAHFHQIIRGVATDRVVLLSTHLMEDATELADLVVILDAGTVRYDGSLADLEMLGRGADRAERLRQAFLSTITPA